MKNIQRILIAALAVIVTATALIVPAMAEGSAGSSAPAASGQTDLRPDCRQNRTPGMSPNGQAPSQNRMPNMNPNGQAPSQNGMPGMNPNGQAPHQNQIPDMNQNDQNPPQSGSLPEKPADDGAPTAPEATAQDDAAKGDASDSADSGDTDAQSGATPKAPADGEAPEMPAKSGAPSGPMPGGMNGQKPEDIPDRVDFASLVDDGVLSQETCDAIESYLQSHAPSGAPEAPTQNEASAGDKVPDDASQPDLLAELQDAGIITQAERDAISASQAE